jgi:putative transposase
VLVTPLDSRLKGLMLEKQQQAYGDAVIEMAVMLDHVHLLLDVDPRLGIDAVVRKIKGYTADTIRKSYPWMKSRSASM